MSEETLGPTLHLRPETLDQLSILRANAQQSFPYLSIEMGCQLVSRHNVIVDDVLFSEQELFHFRQFCLKYDLPLCERTSNYFLSLKGDSSLRLDLDEIFPTH